MYPKRASEYFEENDCFKFKVNNKVIGLSKISHLNELRYLEKIDLKGYTFIGKYSGFYCFGIDNQLARAIKLSIMGNSVIPHKLKFIMDIINRSLKIADAEELNKIATENYIWYSSGGYSWGEEMLKLEKQEQKNKIKYQNNLYNQKLKIRR